MGEFIGDVAAAQMPAHVHQGVSEHEGTLHKGYSKTCGCTQWWCIRQENAMRDAKDKWLDCACTQNGVSPCCSRASQDRWSACLLLLAILRTRRVSAVIHILGDLVVTRQRIKFLDLDGPRAWLACCP
jgi:hypothetical protein